VSWRRVLVLAAALGAASPCAFGQEEAPEGRARPRPGREEAFKMVDAYVVSNLQESLGLTDDQFVKLLPLVKRLQTDRRDYFLRRGHVLHEMRRLLSSGSATEAQVLDLLKELKTQDADGPERTRKDLEAIDAALSPIQQAKYRVLELEVEQRMRELMGRVRTRRPDALPPRE
jgi:Spy/CpxP family protein refolding chaperone